MLIGRAASSTTSTGTSATSMPPTPAIAGSFSAVEAPSSTGGGGLLLEEEEDDREGGAVEEVLVLEARGVVADLKGLRWSFRQLVFPYMKVRWTKEKEREGSDCADCVVMSLAIDNLTCVRYHDSYNLQSQKTTKGEGSASASITALSIHLGFALKRKAAGEGEQPVVMLTRLKVQTVVWFSLACVP